MPMHILQRNFPTLLLKEIISCKCSTRGPIPVQGYKVELIQGICINRANVKQIM